MIKSSKQYEVTRQRLADFASAITEFDRAKAPPEVSERAHSAAYDALVSVRDELVEELAEYDQVKKEGVKAVRFSGLADLPRVLIQTRIARNMTQKALAVALDVPSQQVQRWEAEDYENVGLSYVLEIGEVLNIDEVIAPRDAVTSAAEALRNTLANTLTNTVTIYIPETPNAWPLAGEQGQRDYSACDPAYWLQAAKESWRTANNLPGLLSNANLNVQSKGAVIGSRVTSGVAPLTQPIQGQTSSQQMLAEIVA
jgi:transcriptional regulator with XRE-family HTH domain